MIEAAILGVLFVGVLLIVDELRQIRKLLASPVSAAGKSSAVTNGDGA